MALALSLESRLFSQDGVFKAELNEFLTRELAEDGYSGVEVGFDMARFLHRPHLFEGLSVHGMACNARRPY